MTIEAYQKENQQLKQKIVELTGWISTLSQEILSLKAIISKDSHNSSKPPSSDGFKKKTKSLRSQSGKPRGGQKGNKGGVLEMTATPDIEVIHKVEQCGHCSKDISYLGTHTYDNRQVLDCPPIKLYVTEHKAEVKQCPHCQGTTTAAFPEGIIQKVQYGNGVKGLIAYLMNYQLMPYERTREFIADVFGHSLSGSTLFEVNKKCSANLEDYEQTIKSALIASKTVHFDETGFYYEGKRKWLHSASTKDLTFYYPHNNRGKVAMDEMNILPQYEGTAIHDFWKSYLDYDCNHGLCNVHHLRDLTFCHEQEGSEWAKQQKQFLQKVNNQVNQAKANNQQCLEKCQIIDNLKEYQRLLDLGKKEHPPPERIIKKRGRIKKTKSRNMLERFESYQYEILGFMQNFDIPFDNNRAEQDIRMMKVKQKISGCFRSSEGAEYFARIRGYISTMRKQGVEVLHAIDMAMNKNPIIPACCYSY
jgi:transposase